MQFGLYKIKKSPLKMRLTNEFEFIKNGYNPAEQYKYFYTVQSCFKNRDIKEINALNKLFIEKSKTAENLFYIHMSELTTFLVDYLENVSKINDIKKSKVYTYLINTEFWTHYELSLFKILIYILPCDIIDFMYHRVKSDLDKYSFFHQHGNESFRITYEIIRILLYRGSSIKAIQYIEEIEVYNLANDFYYEIIIQNFLSKLKYKILQTNKKDVDLKNILCCLQELGFYELIEEPQSLIRVTESKNR